MDKPKQPKTQTNVPFDKAYETVKLIAAKAKEEARKRRIDDTTSPLKGDDPEDLARKQTVHINVLSSKMPSLVGVSGEALKRIERVTYTRITVDPTYHNNRGEKRLVLTGLPEDIDRAQAMIGERLDDLPSGFRGCEAVAYLSIPAAKVGLIIGKSGQMIHDIQAAAGAKVAVLPREDPCAVERTVIIAGDEPRVKKAKELIHDVMYGIAGGFQLNGQNSLTISIPDSTIGLIIGKKGECLRQLQEQSGAKIHIESVPMTQSTSGGTRNVHISGAPDAIAAAREVVMAKVAAALKREGKDVDFNYDFGSYNFVSPADASRVANYYPNIGPDQSQSGG